MAANEMTEAQGVSLLRNALLVAGHEMGPEGDHWPVIKSTVHSIVKDFEDLKIERDVFDEIKKHYENTMKELQALHDESPNEAKPEIRQTIAALRDIYDASFTPVRDSDIYMSEVPQHIKRAKAIIETLEDNDDDSHTVR